jgi:hypothetical protein
MIAREEGAFRFTFGDSWTHAECWDNCEGFTRGIGALQGELDGKPEGTKALDFVGLRSGETWLFEIKDFRNRPIELKKRIGELPLEVALKVRDTLAGLLARFRHEDAEPWVLTTVTALANRRAELTVVALVARPAPWRSIPEKKAKAHDDVLMKRTRQLLAWLTRRVFVLDPSTAADHLPDFEVTALAQR